MLTSLRGQGHQEGTWLDFSAERSVYGQVLSQTSTLSTQQYSYDKAGRLILVKDTPQGGGCTTRSYAFDADSNRTKLTTRSPGIGGVCDTSNLPPVVPFRRLKVPNLCCSF